MKMNDVWFTAFVPLCVQKLSDNRTCFVHGVQLFKLVSLYSKKSNLHSLLNILSVIGSVIMSVF